MSGPAASNCSVPPSSGVQPTERDRQRQEGGELFLILMPTYVLLLVLSLVGCALIIFALRRANKRTLTARLLLWTTVIDIIEAPLMQGFVIVTIIVERWVFGGSACQLIAYLTVALRIASILLLLLLAASRYLALSNPCAARETTLYKAGGVGAILATLIGAITAALPFLNTAGYTYIEDIFRCDADGSWAAQMTSFVFIVIPSAIIIGLTLISLKIMKENNCQFGVPTLRGPSTCQSGASDVHLAKRVRSKAALPDVRASRGIAIALLSTTITTLLYMACRQIGPFIPASARKPLLISFEIIYGLCPIIRSSLLLSTCPILKSVLSDWLLSQPQDTSSRPVGQRNFRLTQQNITAPSPHADQTYPSSRTQPAAMMIEAQRHSSLAKEPPMNIQRFRRMSTISTISCDLFYDTAGESSPVSLSREIVTGLVNRKWLSRIDSSLSFVQTESSMINDQSQAPMACSMSPGSADTIAPLHCPRSKSAFVDREIGNGRTSRSDNVTSVSSLSPKDVRYHHPSYSVPPQGNVYFPPMQPMSLPGTFRPLGRSSHI